MIAAVGTVLAGAVSLTVVAGSVTQLTEQVRLRRRESYYRGAITSDLPESDQLAMLLLRRDALARLVARDAIPLRRQRKDFALGVGGFIGAATTGHSLIVLFEEGYGSFYAETGGFGYAIALFLCLMFAIVLDAVMAAVDVRHARRRVRLDFLSPPPGDDVLVRSWVVLRRYRPTLVDISLTTLAISGALLVGEGIALRQQSDGLPAEGSSVALLLTILIFAFALGGATIIGASPEGPDEAPDEGTTPAGVGGHPLSDADRDRT